MPPLPTGRQSTARAAAGMGVITAVSRGLGFVRVLVVAAVLGTTYLGNAFQAANSVSNILFELLAAGALSAVLVPTFVSLLDDGRQEEAEAVAGGVLWVALVGLGAVSIVGVVAAPVLARALTVGVDADVAAEQRELVTYLLRFFVPQVVLYAAGTVATAVLHARRRFAVTAAAPIGNTAVMVAALVAFHAVAAPDAGLSLTSGERALLVVAGTGGVAAFVGSLLFACAASGFRLRPRRVRGDARVHAVLRDSAWGVVLHSGAGILLAAAVVAGAAVPGGVVAYQVAWVFFLAPYGVLAQPIHTAILPELVAEARAGTDAFAASLRWSLERMALLVVPVSAAMVVLAEPGMRAVAFGETGPEGARLLAAGVAALAVGLFPYGAFLLLARAAYALGDSRTPGVVSVVAGCAGAVVMATGAAFTDGVARVAVLGAGHSAAQVLAAAVLAGHVSRRIGHRLWPGGLGRVVVVSGAAATAAWLGVRALIDGRHGRMTDAVAVLVAVVVGAVAVAAGYRLTRVPSALTRRVTRAADELVT